MPGIAPESVLRQPSCKAEERPTPHKKATAPSSGVVLSMISKTGEETSNDERAEGSVAGRSAESEKMKARKNNGT
jgi:hypothetical protein